MLSGGGRNEREGKVEGVSDVKCEEEEEWCGEWKERRNGE